ncbi:copper amine oxidase N-terminal domain-containing protein [Brevibacillus migulae]|uniref:copper amine oxidase N-terminal domain-containing protein n=1 Tax=Brevibacillus migulae TaxID=1644114 RepID=UPI00106E688E|nr:copper amine oxidase N-terminal domain-containing protein [Brevibacillus migulae]
MKTWQKKHAAIFMLALIMLATVGIGQAYAETAILRTTSSHLFQPILEEVVVKDGKLIGTAIVDTQYSDDVIFTFEGKTAKEGYGQLKVIVSGEEQDVVTNVKTKKREIVTTTEGTVTMEVKEIDFSIPLSELPVSSGNYFMQVGDGASDSTQRLFSQAISIELPVLAAAFPGELSLTKSGSIQITLQFSSIYENAKFYLVAEDSNEEVAKRISFNPKSPKISSDELDLEPGVYKLYLMMVSNGESVRSNQISFVVPATSVTPAPNGKYFPGEVSIGEDGTIQLTLTITSLYEKAKFYLVILNEEDEVVKRISISKSSRISAASLNLQPGSYQILIEMVLNGEKYYSESVNWKLPAVTATGLFPIPSGQSFPGGIKVNSNGTITITLEWQTSYLAYTVYLVVLDNYGNIVKRVPLDLNKKTLSIKDLQMLTGGYYVVIEIADPNSGLSARSVPTFVTVNTSGKIIIFIDGQLQVFPKPPVEVNGRTLVPLRAIFEALGAKVEWDEATQTVTATKDNNTIKLTIGSKVAYKNGEKIFLDVPAQLYNGDTTMVPIRFVSEALGAKVGWDAYSNAVIITNQ